MFDGVCGCWCVCLFREGVRVCSVVVLLCCGVFVLLLVCCVVVLLLCWCVCVVAVRLVG